MRDHLNGDHVEIIDISPMGCRTGFYMSLIGTPDEQQVADAWLAAMQDVLDVQTKARFRSSTNINAALIKCIRSAKRSKSPTTF